MTARGLRSNRDGITTRQIQQPTSGPLPDSASPTKNGTVTSVGLTVPSRQTVAGSPVTKAGTLAISDAAQSANQVFAGPVSGGAAVPGFRALVSGDLPGGGSSPAEGTFDPVFTFATPGDLSVSYSLRLGRYWRLGSLVWVDIGLVFTPTFTSGSGEARVTDLPFGVSSEDTGQGGPYAGCAIPSNVTWPASRSYVRAQFMQGSLGEMRIRSFGDGVVASSWTHSQFVTGAAHSVRIAGFYVTEDSP